MSNQVQCANYSLFPIVTYCAKTLYNFKVNVNSRHPMGGGGGQERSEAQFFSFSLPTCAVRLTGLVDLVGVVSYQVGEGYFRYARAPSHQALSDTATKFNMAPDKEWSLIYIFL